MVYVYNGYRFILSKQYYLYKYTYLQCFYYYFYFFQNILFYYDYASCNKPSGVILLEGSYCSKLDFSSGTSKITGKINPENEVNKTNKKTDNRNNLFDLIFNLQHCFVISYNHPQMRQYEFRASTETACKTWVNALKEAR